MQENTQFPQLEQELRKEKDRIEATPVPSAIDQYIHSGIQQAKLRQARHRRLDLVRWGSGMAVCILAAGLFFSIRLSPAVAAYVSHLPGMEKLVELIRDDKGLQLAAEHDLLQPIGAAAKHDGVSFTVDQVLMDQKRMLVFYTIQHEQDGHQVELEKVTFYDANGQESKAGYTWSSHVAEEGRIQQSRLDVYWDRAEDIPDALTAEVLLSVDQAKLATPFRVTFPIDKTKYASLKERVYPIHRDVTVDGQRFTVSNIVVYPTQTEVSLQFDPANTKRILGFDHLRLVDETGRTYAFWGNGIPSRPNGENGVIYNLESCYFSQPQKLVLQADGIRALDKEQLQVAIDANSGSLLKAPDSRLRLTALRQNGDIVGMDFSLRVEKKDENKFLSLGSELTDDRGNQYEFVSGSASSSHSATTESVQTYSNLYKRKTAKGAPERYSFTLTDYPSSLSGGFLVPIK